MMNIQLPDDEGLKRKGRFTRLDWNEDAQYIRADIEITYHNQDGKRLSQFPPMDFHLNADAGSYRDVDGNKIVLEVDENGISIIPGGAINEFEYFKSLNGLEGKIIAIIKAQMNELITQNLV